MNRKEIIVFSVFVNTGLLISLFVFALRPTLKGEMSMDREAVVIVNNTKKEKEMNASELNQVDQILKEYIAKASPAAPTNAPAPVQLSQNVPEAQATDAIPAAGRQAPKVEEPKPEKSSQLIEVIVRQGDFLDKIARRHHTTVEEIMHLNKMNNTRLRIGQIIYLKENTRKKKKLINHTSMNKHEEKHYIVKNGDSPWTIAINNHIKVADLLRLNGLNESKAKKIKPGDKLRIR
jgi:peptidoglycan endopeptidase LytF